tara:strand:- start:203978 stop:205027 length:1050 start_codon:yes stop_codon:yes gene_type:complete
MKRYLKFIAVTALAATILPAYAGNPDRAGSAGAGQLRVNPWAMSGGLANANSAFAKGSEAIFSNVAGLAFTRKTELMFTNTTFLSGADINVAALGFSQKMGESGVLGINVVSMSFGEIERTTVNNPDGGIGTFKPAFSNIAISYAKAFSSTIYGGMTLRIINESIADSKAGGIALDAGVRYVTGEKEHIHFGIAVKNVGPPYSYSGDGIAIQATIDEELITVEQRSDKFELPSLVNIGAAYDWHFTEDENYILSLMGTFTSNSFGKDQVQFGGEFSILKRFKVRGGYMIEKKTEGGNIEIANAITGPSAGFSAVLPFGDEKKSTFSIDYSYRTTNPFNGIHSIGARINL